MKIEALLLIVAALQDHRAAVEGVNLDMAENSVDDAYVGCSAVMEKLVLDTYLKQELEKFPDYVKEAKKLYSDPGLISIYVYTYNELNVYRNLNTADREGKSDYRTLKYNWYSLHFFLTIGLQKLKSGCHNTYRATNMEFNVKGSEVRLGSFASSSLDKEGIKKYGSTTCFEIYTCEGAHIEKYSKHPEEKEVLIPPYEKFKVKDIKKRKDQKDLWCETVIFLESSGIRSDLNCEIVKRIKAGDKKAKL